MHLGTRSIRSSMDFIYISLYLIQAIPKVSIEQLNNTIRIRNVLISFTRNLDNEYLRQQEDLNLFRNDWMEVEVEAGYTTQNDSFDLESGRKPVNVSSTPVGSHVSSDTTVLTVNDVQVAKHRKIPPYKEVYIDVDVGKKSDRPEWGHVRYQSVYKPTEAFEMTIQWVQSTGAIVTELVGNY